MKRALLFSTLLLLLTTTAHAMDFSGYDVRELPVPRDQAEQARRAEVLKKPTLSLAEWNAMSTDQKKLVARAIVEIENAQENFIVAEAAQQREEDARLNPDSLCANAFGADYHFAGAAQRDNADNTFERSILCAKDGPSTRTPFQKRMVQLNGLLMHLRFKMRHPLTEWAG